MVPPVFFCAPRLYPGMAAGAAAVMVAMGDYRCACRGSGYTVDGELCDCAARRIFRACLDRVKERAGESRPHWGPRRVGRVAGYEAAFCAEEFAADVHNCGHRALDAGDWAVFRFHFLQGVDRADLARRLDRSPISIGHAVSRVELIVGRAFVSDGLWPIDEYLGGRVERRKKEQ